MIASIDDAYDTFRRIQKTHTPKVIILGVDLWWLNAKYKHGNTDIADLTEDARYEKLAVEMFRNKAVRKQMFHLGDLREKDTLGGRMTVGLSAAARANGYRLSDGSYQYGKNIQQSEAVTSRFLDTHQRIEHGSTPFQAADDIDYERLESLHRLILEMKESGSHVVVFLPPFPDEIYMRMYNSEKFHNYLVNFEEKTREICQSEGVSFFDCSNLQWLGGADEETYDGFHGSERAYGRVARKLAEDEMLKQYIDLELLDQAVSHPVSTGLLIPCSE